MSVGEVKSAIDASGSGSPLFIIHSEQRDSPFVPSYEGT